VRLKIAKHVDLAFDLSLDAGSIPATSTILRFERSENRRMSRRSSLSYEAGLITKKFVQNNTRAGNHVLRIYFTKFIRCN